MSEVEKNAEYCSYLEKQNENKCPTFVTNDIFKYTFHGCKIRCEVAESVFAKYRVCVENTAINHYDFDGEQTKRYLDAVDRQVSYALKNYDIDSPNLSLNLMYKIYWKQAPGSAYSKKSKENYASDILEVSKYGEDKRIDPERAYLKAEECYIVRKGLRNLSEEERRIIMLRDFENKTWQEIAEQIGNKKANAPFQRYSRILKKLREIILLEHHDYVGEELAN